MAYVLGHLHGHARIVEPHYQRVGRQAQFEQRIHTRANVEQGFEARLLVHELLGRRPDHGIVGLRRAGLPHSDVGAGQRGRKALEPGARLGVGAAEGDFHGVQG